MEIINVDIKPEYEIPKHKILIKRGYVLRKGLPEGFVITDRNVFRHHGRMIRGPHYIIEPGEESKTSEVAKKIAEEAGDSKKIIALGGGIVGDLATYHAATSEEEIDLTHIPTSLIAMLDSSTGGKGSINIGNIKNATRVFHYLHQVLTDLSFLWTLPGEEFRNGLGEVGKYGYLFPKPILDKLGKINQFTSDLDSLIIQCCRNKVSLVEIDPYDEGPRHALNLGHTIGHAIELPYGLKHGEAVAIGATKEIELAISLGLAKREEYEKLKNFYETNGLSTDLPENLDQEEVLRLMRLDKKGEYVFAFSREDYAIKVEEKDIRKVLTS